MTSKLKKTQEKWLENTGITWHKSDIKDNMYKALVDVGEGIELCVEVGGCPNNPPLLLVIGLGSQMIFWPDELIDGLIDAGFFVIRFDNRDCGLSSKIKIRDLEKPPLFKMIARMQVGLSNEDIPVAYTLVDMVNDTCRLIKRLGFADFEAPTQSPSKKLNILGVSMGGIISQILASKYPHLVDKLILLFSTTNRPLLLPPKPTQLRTLFKSPKSLKKEDMIAHSIWFVNTVGSPGYINQQQIREIAELRYHRCVSQLGTRQQFNAILSTGSIKEYSKKIKAPTLVLHGEKDGLIPYRNGRDTARIIPNAQFDLIKGMGHDLAQYYLPYIVQKIASHCKR